MEIKATLNKPYSEEQRIDFIIQQNRRYGYKIKETEIALEAWGYTEEEIAEQEAERISHLRCTKRVLILEQLGFDYFEQIEPLINSNRQAKLEWELCVELERSNPLLNIMGSELGITPQQIDNVFKYANGEIKSLGVEE